VVSKDGVIATRDSSYQSMIQHYNLRAGFDNFAGSIIEIVGRLNGES